MIFQEALSLREKRPGIEWYGNVKKVGFLLKEYRNRFPLSFSFSIDRLISISRHLRRHREMSFYGDEAIGTPSQAL